MAVAMVMFHWQYGYAEVFCDNLAIATQVRTYPNRSCPVVGCHCEGTGQLVITEVIAFCSTEVTPCGYQCSSSGPVTESIKHECTWCGCSDYDEWTADPCHDVCDEHGPSGWG